MPKRKNTQMFALQNPPPATLRVGTSRYELVRVFKHDFFAATTLYHLTGEDRAPGQTDLRIVVKFARKQRLLGIPCEWMGKLLCDQEERIYEQLAGVHGVPRWIARIDDTTCAIQYIEGEPLDHLDTVSPEFFDHLRTLLDRIHARGVGYCDTNKRSNIIVTPGAEAFLVDYQISVRTRDDWCWGFRHIRRAIVRYIAQKDLYHLYKHKRRICPEALTPEEEALSHRRTSLHRLHRKLTKPYRALRRGFLRGQYRKGQLVSPTADLENHYQPEKATWKQEKGQKR